ncbi:hypothetical protein [Jiella pelagia]|uniref:Uncharacterized protein n=1 Tax=Jiella pelagia TaxID=2986949 RepID=A0ABY7BY90_9HYPH|nr:hypothetical protein [Jiella pelagia]WAP67744.1 hypothetical protein OH818_20035 [Jiella pelagia]
MNSRELTGLLTAGLLAIGGATPAAAADDNRPNIVVAVADNPPTLEPAKEALQCRHADHLFSVRHAHPPRLSLGGRRRRL